MKDGFKTFVRLPTPGNELSEEDWLNHALACVEAGADGLVTFSAPERLSPALALIRQLKTRGVVCPIYVGMSGKFGDKERNLLEAGVQGVVYLDGP